VICTLAADGWAVTFGTARRGLGGLASVPTSYYLVWHSKELTQSLVATAAAASVISRRRRRKRTVIECICSWIIRRPIFGGYAAPF